MSLLYKPDNTVYQIFDITYDKHGSPLFLFYQNGQWLRKSAEYFTPNFYEDGMGGYTVFG